MSTYRSSRRAWNENKENQHAVYIHEPKFFYLTKQYSFKVALPLDVMFKKVKKKMNFMSFELKHKIHRIYKNIFNLVVLKVSREKLELKN